MMYKIYYIITYFFYSVKFFFVFFQIEFKENRDDRINPMNPGPV